ncbi:MAG: hypothetical protein ACO29P_09530 [Bacteroidia bacterium]
MKATNVKLSTATIKAIGDYTGKKIGAGKGLTKAVDSLYADGVQAEMMFAPKKDEDRTFYTTLEVAVVCGFSTNAQAMLKADVKTLAEVDEAKAKANRDLKCKANRRYWQQQIGSGIKDLRNSLAKRFATDEGGAEADKSTWEATKRKVLADIISQAQKKESSTIKDLSAFIKDLQSALARIPANA